MNKNELINKINMIVDIYLDNNIDSLKKTLENIKNEEYENLDKVRSEENEDFIYGEYIGCLIVIEKLMEKKKSEIEVENLMLEIPHVHEIIKCIYNNEGIKHIDLSNKTNISKTNLTGIMGKLFDIGLITSVNLSKYKYYYLTDFGKEQATKIIEKEKEINKKAKELMSKVFSYYASAVENNDEYIFEKNSSEPLINKSH